MDTQQDPTPKRRPRKALSLRQREFALRLARGIPAVKAAIEAGYSPSTAQSNAQRLMRNPLVVGFFDTIRKNRIHVNTSTTSQVITTLLILLQKHTHPTVQLRAAELLLTFRKRQQPAHTDIYLTPNEHRQFCGYAPTDPDIYATFDRETKAVELDNQIIDSLDLRDFLGDDIPHSDHDPIAHLKSVSQPDHRNQYSPRVEIGPRPTPASPTDPNPRKEPDPDFESDQAPGPQPTRPPGSSPGRVGNESPVQAHQPSDTPSGPAAPSPRSHKGAPPRHRGPLSAP